MAVLGDYCTYCFEWINYALSCIRSFSALFGVLLTYVKLVQQDYLPDTSGPNAATVVLSCS